MDYLSSSQETFMIKQNYKVKPNVILINRVTKEQVSGNIINEDDIEGKTFYVFQVGNRVMKLSKEAFSIKNH